MDTSNLPKHTVWLERNEDGAWTNLPIMIVDKAAGRGIDWGYSGSGPADLALNILEWAMRMSGFRGPRTHVLKGTCFLKAYLMHQQYKVDVIAKVPHRGAGIRLKDVWEWIQAYDQTYGNHEPDEPEF